MQCETRLSAGHVIRFTLCNLFCVSGFSEPQLSPSPALSVCPGALLSHLQCALPSLTAVPQSQLPLQGNPMAPAAPGSLRGAVSCGHSSESHRGLHEGGREAPGGTWACRALAMGGCSDPLCALCGI